MLGSVRFWCTTTVPALKELLFLYVLFTCRRLDRYSYSYIMCNTLKLFSAMLYDYVSPLYTEVGTYCAQSVSVCICLPFISLQFVVGGGPRVVVSTAAFHARVRGSVPSLGGLKETKTFLPHPRVKVSIVGSLRDREVTCSASDRQGSSFESCVWKTVSSQSSHHSQEVLLAHHPGSKSWHGELLGQQTCVV